MKNGNIPPGGGALLLIFFIFSILYYRKVYEIIHRFDPNIIIIFLTTGSRPPWILKISTRLECCNGALSIIFSIFRSSRSSAAHHYSDEKFQSYYAGFSQTTNIQYIKEEVLILISIILKNSSFLTPKNLLKQELQMKIKVFVVTN